VAHPKTFLGGLPFDFKEWVTLRLGFPPRLLLADRRLLIIRFSSFLTSRNHDTPSPPRSRPAADDDIHVAVQRGQKIHQPFDGKALQLVIR
jgi:hypothetical protein